MTPKELRAHKKAEKALKAAPIFKQQSRNKLPKPFKKLGGPRIFSSGMMEVSEDHVAFMYWRDGAIFTDRSFYGFLFCKLMNGDLGLIFEFHWHPSHKGFHCKTPCKTDIEYVNRLLAGAPELAIKTSRLDPRNETDRNKLVIEFCSLCGISLPSDPKQGGLWQ